MKNSSKLIIGTVILLSFIIGLLLGISIDYPKTDNSKLAGTIGRMSNYRNVQVTENDIKLRSELQSNAALKKGYQQYFSFHYANTAKLCEDIGFAIQTSESTSEFKNIHQTEIEEVNQYLLNLEQARKDILLALTALQNLSDANGNSIGLVINNANIAIAQAKYKQEDLTRFVEAIEAFLKVNNQGDFADLKKAHDLLSMNQIILAAATNDKPMLKYLDKKAFLSGSEQLQVCDKEKLNEIFQSDFEKLGIYLSDNKELGILFNSETIGNIEKQLTANFQNIEKLGVLILNSDKLEMIIDKENLGAISKDEKLDMIVDKEKLGTIAKNEKLGAGKEEKLGIFFNAEKLGRILNAEKLGISSNEKLGLLNLEKLSAWDKESLNSIYN